MHLSTRRFQRLFNEIEDLKKKLALAVYMAANEKTPAGEDWSNTIASLELACRPFEPGS